MRAGIMTMGFEAAGTGGIPWKLRRFAAPGAQPGWGGSHGGCGAREDILARGRGATSAAAHMRRSQPVDTGILGR
jgi:hypothetical protein